MASRWSSVCPSLRPPRISLYLRVVRGAHFGPRERVTRLSFSSSSHARHSRHHPPPFRFLDSAAKCTEMTKIDCPRLSDSATWSPREWASSLNLGKLFLANSVHVSRYTTRIGKKFAPLICAGKSRLFPVPSTTSQ